MKDLVLILYNLFLNDALEGNVKLLKTALVIASINTV